MRLYLIRHADPDYENNTITPYGHLEAAALAKRLSREKITRIHCSPMQRAIDTMQYTAEALKLDYEIHDWMREVEWEDTIEAYRNPWDLPGELLIGEKELPDTAGWKSNPYFDGEKLAKDYEDRAARFDSFLQENGYQRKGNRYIELRESHENIAMFCHAGFANAMFSHLMNIPLTTVWADFWMAPSAVTIILFSRRDSPVTVPRCIAYGDTSHLYAEGLPVRPRGLKGSFS